MTKDQTPAQTPVPGSESNADGSEATPEGGSTGEGQKSNNEARFRQERNEARSERDALAQRVEALQLRELEHYAGQHIADPKDLLTLSGKALADLLDDDGYVNPEAVRVAAAEVVATRPGLSTRQPAFDPTQGSGGAPSKSGPSSWADLFKS